MWQALREDLAPKGVEVVTVALDAGGAAAARPFIEAAAPRHPSLVDATHLTAERFGFVNVPNAVWIDEDGVIVRPAHAAHVRPSRVKDVEVTPEMGVLGEFLTEIKRFHADAEAYRSAIDDWVADGPDSRYALSPDEVVAASRPRPREHAEAAAAFELAQHLHRQGHVDDAVRWFKLAHEKHPEHWTYKRQAWTLATTPEGGTSDLAQFADEVYGTSWLTEVRRLGAETYYDEFPA